MPSPIQDGKVYILTVAGGGVISQVTGPWGPNSVELRSREADNPPSQKWRAESSHSLFGFRSLKNDRLLGANKNDDPAAEATEKGSWEEFSVADQNGKYQLAIKKDGTWKSIYKRSGAENFDFDRSNHTLVTIEEA